MILNGQRVQYIPTGQAGTVLAVEHRCSCKGGDVATVMFDDETTVTVATSKLMDVAA